jgi:hypothetical protein
MTVPHETGPGRKQLDLTLPLSSKHTQLNWGRVLGVQHHTHLHRDVCLHLGEAHFSIESHSSWSVRKEPLNCCARPAAPRQSFCPSNTLQRWQDITTSFSIYFSKPTLFPGEEDWRVTWCTHECAYTIFRIACLPSSFQRMLAGISLRNWIAVALHLYSQDFLNQNYLV